MTAEIAIANRQAIVLAADSAVTIGGERVWKHGNKIFSLGPTNDIAVMIYGSGEFSGFPWDTVIKTFRKETVDKQFRTVSDCGSALLQFLRDPRFVPDATSRLINFGMVVDELERMKRELPPYSKKLEFRKSFADVCDRFDVLAHDFGGATVLRGWFLDGLRYSSLTIFDAVSAPRYDERALCESEHGGACVEEVHPDGSHVFLPVMAGYLLGRGLSGGQAGLVSSPLYGVRGGGYATPSGDTRVASASGPATVRASGFQPAAATQAPLSRATVASRGGFGAGRASGGALAARPTHPLGRQPRRGSGWHEAAEAYVSNAQTKPLARLGPAGCA